MTAAMALFACSDRIGALAGKARLKKTRRGFGAGIGIVILAAGGSAHSQHSMN